MTPLLGTAFLAVFLIRTLLLARIVLEIITSYARSFRPRGLVLVLFETVFTVTDPPVKLLRRWIPPLRLGAVSLDLSILILLVAAVMIEGILVGQLHARL